jgi:hypothetical protein
MTLGASWYVPGSIVSQDGSYEVDADGTWRFAFTLGGGLNVFLTPRLAVRLQARMLAPVLFSSGGFYAGTGGLRSLRERRDPVPPGGLQRRPGLRALSDRVAGSARPSAHARLAAAGRSLTGGHLCLGGG